MAKLRQSDVNKAKPRDTKYKLWDDGGLYLLVQPSGVKSYYLLYKDPNGKKREIKIADGGASLQEARERAQMWKGTAARGNDPQKKYKPGPEDRPKVEIIKDPTVLDVRNAYKAYLIPDNESVTPPLKNGPKTLGQIDAMRLFDGFFDKRFSQIDYTVIQQYINFAKTERKNREVSINGRLRNFYVMWNWGIKNNLISDKYQPPERQKLQEKDSTKRLRYLTPEERERLYRALDEREKVHGVDYLKTAVIISNYTGIRQGALLALKWGDLTEHTNGKLTMHLSPMSSKSVKDYDLPLSERVVSALKDWKRFSEKEWGTVSADNYVIRYGKLGAQLTEIKRSWLTVLKQAEITCFRWHDLRHDFASQLVMRGVPIEQVQKLMTHETIAMTLRYAHLAPNVLQDAANKLNSL